MADMSVTHQCASPAPTAVQELARRSLAKSLEPGEMEKDSRDLLDGGFAGIQQLQGISKEERALAELGRAFKNTIQDRYPASLAMLTLMSHLASASLVTSPVGAVVGKECASISVEVEKFFNGKPAAADIYSTGFSVIANNQGATEEEKTLARLGEDVAKTPLSVKDRFLAGREVMNAIAGTTEESLTGAHIAGLSLQAALKVESAQDARHILDSGFKAIRRAPDPTAREKDFARLGAGFGHSSLDHYASAVGKMLVMDAIAVSIPGTMGAAVSSLAMKIMENTPDDTEDPGLQRDMLDSAFGIIQDSPLSLEEEKKLAGQGLAVRDESISEGRLGAQKFLIMKQLSELQSSPPGGEAIPHDSDLNVDDDSIEIDGFKIDRKQQ